MHRRRLTDRPSKTRDSDGIGVRGAVGGNATDKLDGKAQPRMRKRLFWSSTASGPGGQTCGHLSTRLSSGGDETHAQTGRPRACWRRLGLLWAAAPLLFFLYSIQLFILVPMRPQSQPIFLAMFQASARPASRLPFPAISTLKPLEHTKLADWPDYDGIRMKGHSLQDAPSNEFRRYIRPNDEEEFEEYREEMLHEYEEERVYIEEYHDDELEYDECQRPSFRNVYYCNCNAFHEIDIQRLDSDDVPNFDVHMFSHGYFRDVWKVLPLDGSDPLVLKTTRWKHDLNDEYINKVHRDASVMIALASSPRIVNIHGACAGSVSVAPAVGQLQLEFLLRDPFDEKEQEAYINVRDLHDKEDVNPLNNLTATQKIDYALAMSEAIADLH